MLKMPFGAKNTSFYLSIFMKFFVWWCYYRVLKYSTWVVFDKNFGSPQHPQPRFFGIRRLVTTQIFQNFWGRKFFEGRWVEKKFFSRKDVFWVTCRHMKHLGHYRACITWATAAEIAKKAGFGHFWPNPQMGFWAILTRGCVGAGRQHMERNLWT